MKLNLRDLIKAVRQELIEAEEERLQTGIVGTFRLSTVQLEVQFVLEPRLFTVPERDN